MNGRAWPDACSSAALATISALSASLAARVRLRAGSSTTISFPFLFSRPISITESNKDAALRATASKMVRAKLRTLGVQGVDARVWCKARGRRHGGGARRAGDGADGGGGGRGCARAVQWRVCGRRTAVARLRADGGEVVCGWQNSGGRAAAMRRCNAAARVGGKGGDARRTSRRRGGVWEAEGGKTEETSGGARTIEIYDMWPPRIFLSPVDPTLRVQTSVDCVGVVYQGLCQVCICTPVEPMLR
jgi:hypothetical protein